MDISTQPSKQFRIAAASVSLGIRVCPRANVEFVHAITLQIFKLGSPYWSGMHNTFVKIPFSGGGGGGGVDLDLQG